MSSVNSANHIIDCLVREGKQIIHQHKLVKQMMTPHSVSYAMSMNQDLFYQIGTRKQGSSAKIAQSQYQMTEKLANNINLDRRSYLSMKVNKRVAAQTKKQSTLLQQTPKKSKLYKKKTIKSNSFVISPDQFFKNEKLNADQKQQKGESKCVKIIQQTKQMTRYQKKIEDQQLNIRMAKAQNDKQKQLQIKDEGQKTSRQKERHQKLVSYLQNHIQRPGGCFTFHIDGSLLLFQQGGNDKKQKQFPHSIRHSFSQNISLDDSQHNLRQRKQYNRFNKKSTRSNIQNQKNLFQNNHQIKGARGQIFKSSVLKTVNLSRISLGVTNGNVDAVLFMKRNDLFNNNHSRQTTSIPFIDVKQGLVYTQVQTNQCISKKEASTKVNTENDDYTQNLKSRARSQDSRYKGAFRKYATTRYIDNQSVQDISQNNSKIMPNMVKRQVKSVSNTRYAKSLHNKRPNTQQIGRITTASQSLVQEMIQ